MGESPVSQLKMCFQEPFVFSFTCIAFSILSCRGRESVPTANPPVQAWCRKRGTPVWHCQFPLIHSEMEPSALNIFSPRKSLSTLWSLYAFRGESKSPIQIRCLPFGGWSKRELKLQYGHSAFNSNGDMRNSVTTTLYFLRSSLHLVIGKVSEFLILLKLYSMR